MTDLLGDDELERRIQAAQDGVAAQPDTPHAAAPSEWRYIRPFSDAADGLIETMTNPHGRLKFGIRDIDVMTRGIGRGELCFITGLAHAGKTQLVLQAVANKAHGRWLYFTPDEVAELVLMKLACITRGLNAEEIEEQIVAGDEDMRTMLQDVAAKDFPNLLVIDEGINFGDMKLALQEAEAYWASRSGDDSTICDGVVIDYLELLPGDADHDGVNWKVQELKRFTKAMNVPVVCLHQGKRGDRGRTKGMDGMRYAGQNEATFVIDVFRKCQDEKLDAFEQAREAHTITANVAKNKRPPCKTGIVDLFIHPHTGGIRPLQEGDRFVQGDPASKSPIDSYREAKAFEATVRAGGFDQPELPTEATF